MKNLKAELKKHAKWPNHKVPDWKPIACNHYKVQVKQEMKGKTGNQLEGIEIKTDWEEDYTCHQCVESGLDHLVKERSCRADY